MRIEVCRPLTKDFPDGLQWKKIKLAAPEGVGKVSRIKRSCSLLSGKSLWTKEAGRFIAFHFS